MSATASRSIENLERTWQSVLELCEPLDEQQWKTPTGCPGWSVQDNISHLVDYEERALGRPGPDHRPSSLAHVKNELGEANEVGVDHRRALSGHQVLAQLREIVRERTAQLHGPTPEDLDQPVTTPAGPGTAADMLTLRVMDTWSHEQDIRRALGLPGHETGPAVEESVGYLSRFLPFVVGKRAAAPEGSLVVFDIDGVNRLGIEVVDGRARPVEPEAGEATVRLRMPASTFAALTGGRSDAPTDVEVEGDEALAARILGSMGFMP